MTKLIAFSVNNAYLCYKDKMPMVLRLIQPALHGDIKDMSRKLVPAGKYNVESIYDNYYGRYIRIFYDNKFHDIEPKYFEWYNEDQAHIDTV